MSAGIYAIVCAVTGRAYVGQTAMMRKRENRHFADLRGGRHHCNYLQRAFDKYGPDAFAFVVLEKCEASLLTEREQCWMEHYQRDSGLYNSAPAAGSVLGIKRTPEHREKIAAALRGKKHAPERVAKVVAAIRARVVTDEARSNMSMASKGRPKSLEMRRKLSASLKGVPKSPEHRAKLSEAAKRRYACL